MVQRKREYCLSGDPEATVVSAEFQCHWLVEMVDLPGPCPPGVGARRGAVSGSREADAPVLEGVGCKCRRDSITSEARTRPVARKTGRYMRDHIICTSQLVAWIGTKGSHCWPVEVVGQFVGYASEASDQDRKKDIYSICRAVIEVLERTLRLLSRMPTFPPYNMVRGAWQTIPNRHIRPNKRENHAPAGRYFNPKVWSSYLNHPPARIDTAESNAKRSLIFPRSISGECAQRDLDGTSDDFFAADYLYSSFYRSRSEILSPDRAQDSSRLHRF